MGDTARLCPECNTVRPEKSFRQISKNAREGICLTCRHRRYRQKYPDKVREQAAHKRQKFPDGAVLSDCKQSDRKNGRVGFDLDRPFVKEQLAKPCSYCGGSQLKITLDRVDNALAHTKANVVPACIRCNYIRNSMPYEAWLNIAPAIRETYEKGLFGDWRTEVFHRKHAKLALGEIEYPLLTAEERRVMGAKQSAETRTGKTRIDWPSDDDLIKEVESTSLRKVADRLGCSHVLVGKRLGRYK